MKKLLILVKIMWNIAVSYLQKSNLGHSQVKATRYFYSTSARWSFYPYYSVPDTHALLKSQRGHKVSLLLIQWNTYWRLSEDTNLFTRFFWEFVRPRHDVSFVVFLTYLISNDFLRPDGKTFSLLIEIDNVLILKKQSKSQSVIFFTW